MLTILVIETITLLCLCISVFVCVCVGVCNLYMTCARVCVRVFALMRACVRLYACMFTLPTPPSETHEPLSLRASENGARHIDRTKNGPGDETTLSDNNR